MLRLFIFLLLSMSSANINACSCIGFAFNIQTSNVILKGKVESLSTEKYATIANVKVIQVYKGVVNEKIIPIKYDGGSECGANYFVGEISTFVAIYDNQLLSTFGCIKPSYKELPLIQPVLDSYFYKVKKLSSEMRQQEPSVPKLEKLLRIQEDAGDNLQALQTAQSLLKLKPKTIAYMLSSAKAKANLVEANKSYAKEASLIYKQILEKQPNHSPTMKAQFKLLAKLNRANEFKGNLKDFSELELHNLDLSDRDLSDANFANTKLNNVNLKGCKLDNANFSNSMLSSTNFAYARIRKSNFNNAYIYDTDFAHADFSESDFRKSLIINSKLLNGNFKKIKYEYMQITGNPNITGSEFDPHQLYIGDNL